MACRGRSINLIERALVATRSDCQAKVWPELSFPTPPEQVFIEPQSINLEVDDTTLETISTEGLLALNLNEMHAIQAHYRTMPFGLNVKPWALFRMRQPALNSSV